MFSGDRRDHHHAGAFYGDRYGFHRADRENQYDYLTVLLIAYYFLPA
jgi:hypothetical protein